jgi:hypothetical protein
MKDESSTKMWENMPFDGNDKDSGDPKPGLEEKLRPSKNNAAFDIPLWALYNISVAICYLSLN